MRKLLFCFLLVAAAASCRSEPQIDGRSLTEWISLFRHEDWQTRSRAQDLLARLGEESLPYLQRSLRSPDPAIRRGCIITMRKMGAKARPALGTLLGLLAREEVDALRAEILVALVAIDPQRAEVQETFRKRLQDRSEQVRAAAQAGLDFANPPPPVSVAGEKKAPPAELKLREALSEKLGKTDFALFAEVEREDLRAAIYLPLFHEGAPLAGKTSGLVFRREGKKWTAVGEPFILAGSQGAEVLARALKGADKQQVSRPCGVPAEKLFEHLAAAAAAFDSARRNKDGAAAARAAEEMARAFDYRGVAFGERLPAMLQENFWLIPWQMEGQPDGKSVLASRRLAEKEQKLRLFLAACGEGAVITAIEEAVATKDEGGEK